MDKVPPIRFLRIRLKEFPVSEGSLHVGDVFRLSASIEAKNAGPTTASIKYEAALVELVDSPAQVKIEGGSYSREVEWLMRALKPASGTCISVEVGADDMYQAAMCPVTIVAEANTRGQTD